MSKHNANNKSQVEHGQQTIVDQLSQTTSQIREINTKISSIAINASVEAARSHMYSDNFTVVADQLSRQVDSVDALIARLEDRSRKVLMAFYEFQGGVLSQRALGYSLGFNCQIEHLIDLLSIYSSSRLSASVDDTQVYLQDPFFKVLRELFCDRVGFYLCEPSGKVSFVSDDWGMEEDALGELSRVLGKLDKRVDLRILFQEDHCNLWLRLPIGQTDSAVVWRLTVTSMFHKFKLDGEDKIFFADVRGKSFSRFAEMWVQQECSWLNSFEELARGKQGFSIESDLNGWPTFWGFSPVVISLPRSKSMWKGGCVLAEHCGTLGVQIDVKHAVKTDDASRTSSILESIEVQAQDLRALLHDVGESTGEMNILAVNAAIQASMAGGEGKAFSVVADQIGRLSEETTSIVDANKNLFTHIQSYRENVFQKLVLDCQHSIVSLIKNYFASLSRIVSCLIDLDNYDGLQIPGGAGMISLEDSPGNVVDLLNCSQEFLREHQSRMVDSMILSSPYKGRDGHFLVMALWKRRSDSQNFSMVFRIDSLLKKLSDYGQRGELDIMLAQGERREEIVSAVGNKKSLSEEVPVTLEDLVNEPVWYIRIATLGVGQDGLPIHPAKQSDAA